MDRLENARETVLEASRAYYAHLGYYEDLLAAGTTKRELGVLEFAFHVHAAHRVRDVLDVACGSGRHVVGLARRGYNCIGQDYTPEQVQMAQARVKREGVSVTLLRGDAMRLRYESEFDAVLALYILFLLPDDDGVLACLRQVHRALKSGGVLVCNVANPFYGVRIGFLSNRFNMDIISRKLVFEACAS